MVATAGAGPHPIPHASLTPENLAAAIQFCLTPSAAAAAHDISLKMRSESGVEAAVASFHANLPPIERMQCDIMPDQPAVWKYKKGKKVVKLSKAAGEVLVSAGKIDGKNLKL